MHAEFVSTLTPALDSVVCASSSGVCLVTGPPGSGKTTALAARAAFLTNALHGDVVPERSSGFETNVVPERSSGAVLVICAYESGVRAFRAALARLGATGDIRVGTAPAICLSWLRTHYALTGVRPEVRAGGEQASRAIVREAAAGLLAMTWPELREGDVDLNIPFLSRPDKFLDEAAQLIRQLRAARVSPDEFERACAGGLSAFYGDEVEAALAKCRDPNVRARVSRRGREAISVGPAVLQSQRRAERDLGIVLARLYREYLRAVRIAPLLSDEDIVAECLRWLAEDGRSARAIAAEFAAVLVDDAEDAHPGVADLLIALAAAGLPGVTLAGCPETAVGGLDGRRSALDAMQATQHYILPPLVVPAAPTASRFANETEEAAHLAAALADLVREGVSPAEAAVLTRSVDAAAVYARLLEERGLPADAPLDRFAAPQDIADWLSLAAILDDPYDHAHMLRVLASPLLGLADASIYALCEDPAAVTQLALEVGVNDERKRAGAKRQHTALARNMLEGDVDARLPEPTRELVVRFRAQLSAWRESLAGLASAAAIAHLARVSGFQRRWEFAPEHRRARLADDALRVIEAFASDGTRGVRRSLNTLVHAYEDGMLPIRPAGRSGLAIACDTITGAKGERWRHVFIAGLAHERFPRVYVSRAMAFSRTYGLIVRENVAPGAAQTAKFAWYYARFDAKSLYLAEERRALAYGLSRGVVSASASGFGKPPRWAKDGDLLSTLPA